MRTVELIQLLALPAWFVAMLMLATRRKIVRQLERAHAVDEPSAIVLEESRPWRRWVLARLVGRGVVQAAPGGRYWLDGTVSLQQWRARRRRGLIIAACVALAGAIAAFAGLWP